MLASHLGFKKEILSFKEFYLAKFTKDIHQPYFIFIHGGPGFNCGAIEYFIEHEQCFKTLDFNIILYDQRSCGRSKNFEEITHSDNINDLYNIYNFLMDESQLDICGFIGHSYGAKLLFDAYQKFDINLPSVFVAVADSMLTPRLNNLMLDLAYLKSVDQARYESILQQLEQVDLNKIWDLTEELSPLFQQNKNRPYLYWANLSCLEKYYSVQKLINLPLNMNTFVQVRKDLYANPRHFSLKFDQLTCPYLWINGFHDFIMNGTAGILSDNVNVKTFYQSAHYPHLEENERFCNVINQFINTLKKS